MKVLIVASGPSAAQVPLEKFSRRVDMVIFTNRAYMHALPDWNGRAFAVTIDDSNLKQRIKDFEDWRKRKKKIDYTYVAGVPNPWDYPKSGPKVIYPERVSDCVGLMRGMSHISAGGNSGFAALDWAQKFSPSKILMTGYDFQDFKTHFYEGDRESNALIKPEAVEFSIRCFRHASRTLAPRVAMCSPGSALTMFRNFSESEALEWLST